MDIRVCIGAAVTILLTAGIAVSSGLSVKKGPPSSGAHITIGLILGTLVGGASTVGTAQLAYQYGMSAWWFTLGGGLACLILSFVYVRPLRGEECPTLTGMITKEYGKNAGMMASILNSVGTFIGIISQLLSASAVIAVILPGAGLTASIALSALLMLVYVVFGGTKGAGIVGIFKLLVLYGAMILCGTLAAAKAGGPVPFLKMVHEMSKTDAVNYTSLFARGFRQDFGAALSMILGVLTTQIYATAVIQSRTMRSARVGAWISAVLILPIGILGILVGLYMRSITDPVSFEAKNTLTEFILRYSGLPPAVAGAILGVLFIASAGTGAGLALGVAHVLRQDILGQFIHREFTSSAEKWIEKILIAVILALGCLLSLGSMSDVILIFSFMSMGLRGATVFIPLCFLLWKKGCVDRRCALAAIILGPVTCLLFGVIPALNTFLDGWDALFPGIIAGFVIMLCGWNRNSAKKCSFSNH